MSKKKVLDTMEEIEKVCRLHYDTKAPVSMIARNVGASESAVRRVIKENGAQYLQSRQQQNSN